MAVYFITGKLGSGKTLCAVGKIRDYLSQGRKVATNLDLYLDNMCSTNSQKTVLRLPDKPRVDDLLSLGMGCDDEDEDQYGAIVLDELGTWFNTRSWNDKTRLPLIDWFLHARKKHWDVFFIVQNVDNVDKQLKNSLCEHLVICGRTDRLSVPFLSSFLRIAGIEKILPKFHYANVYYGDSASGGIKVARWWYRGRDLYSAYNTAQIFHDDLKVLNDCVVDFRASYTVLSAYDLNSIRLIDKLENQIELIKNPSCELDLLDKSPQGAFRVKKDYLVYSALLIVVFVSFGFYSKDFKSSVDEQQVVSTEKQTSAVKVSSVVKDIIAPSVVPVADSVPKKDVVPTEYFLNLIYKAKVDIGFWSGEGSDFNAVITITKENERFPHSMTLDDLRVIGWIVVRRGNFLFLHKEGFTPLTYRLG